MEILSHFRTIEELTKTLSREQGLLSEMFEKRKLMKFPLGVALELVGGTRCVSEGSLTTECWSKRAIR